MGKSVPKAIKSRSNILIKMFPEKFSRDFEKNKLVIDSFELPFSKTDRNLIAGFITRKMADVSS
tara:strand:+ start:4321 stop:4512 length:192 start_codon:yes stop_codon:yes gene_type:complete